MNLRSLVGFMLCGLCFACGASNITVPLVAQNNSGESGTAMLTDKGNGTTQIALSLTLGADTGNQLNHIHDGNCEGLGGIFVPLNVLVSGKAITVVPFHLSDLQGGKYAITVHNSVNPLTPSLYQACGNIQ